MEKIGYIEIRISGSKGNLEITPDNYDIREISKILENAENMLFPHDKRERPQLSYRIEDGSVRHIFKTFIQYIIGFNAVIGQVNQNNSIDFLENETAIAIENIQTVAAKNNYVFYIKTSIDKSNELKIDNNTNFYRTEALWVDAEFYFYGKLTNAGGKDKANIHIHTEELGTLRIQTPIKFLETYNENLLYKTFGIRAIGKQNSETGEIDKTSLKFLNLLDYQKVYDKNYLSSLRKKAKESWLKNINPDNWLREVRGTYD